MGKLPVALQVYNLRDILQEAPEKFAPTMKAVKELGYDGVELAGLYGLPAEKVRDAIKGAGLVAISAHVPLSEMTEDIQRVIHDYGEVIGCPYVAVPFLPDELRPNTPGYEGAIAAIDAAGAALNKAGVKLLYHNHDFEFVKVPGGAFGLDDIYARIPPEKLLVEPDTCWIKVAGQDPVAFIRKYGSRCHVVHLKDFIMQGTPKRLYELLGIASDGAGKDEGFFEFRPIGFGQQIWEPILDASLAVGAKWVVVEQDLHYGIGGLEAARRSREYLKILGW